MSHNGNGHEFSKVEKNGLYRAIFERRDVRKEFLNRRIPKKILKKILTAAHHAGSVGFMQPWNFIVIKDKKIKKKVKDVFLKANAKAKGKYQAARRKLYSSLKLEGIMESPINICITCNPRRGGKNVLGRDTIKETDVFSTCCAIQNLWLAARAEGIGVGWVSIINNTPLKKALKIPGHIKPIAYLCMGYVSDFPNAPMLETAGWRKRIDINTLISWDGWGNENA